MKAEQRKELETNSLVRWLQELFETVKGGPSRNTWIFLGVAGAIVGIWFIWWYTSTTATQRDSELWLQVDQATSLDDLKKVADANRGTTVGSVAEMQMARIKLREGLGEIYRDSKKAHEQLQEAAGTFEKVAGQFEGISLLSQEALVGAGEAREATGEFDKARELYQRVIKKDSERKTRERTGPSLYATRAEAGLKRLENTKTLDELKIMLKP